MYSKTVIVGNLGKDPESKFSPSGKQITTFNVAVNRGADKTTWYRVTTFETLAENCEKYLKKGSKVLVEGIIDVSAWIDNNKEARATLELTANTVKFLSERAKNDDSNDEPPPF